MISNVITYLIIGVLFNFVFDKLVDFNGEEEHRFTMGERLSMTVLWPLGVGMFVFHFIKQFTSSDNK